MSQTIQNQIEKSRNLAAGLRKHMIEGGSGVTVDEITAMDKVMTELETANAEVERLREELAPKVKHANELLAQVKNTYLEKKTIIKRTYPQEKWLEYGLPDKR